MQNVKSKDSPLYAMKTLYTEGLDSEGFVKLCEEIFSAFYKSKTKRSFLSDDGNTIDLLCDDIVAQILD